MISIVIIILQLAFMLIVMHSYKIIRIVCTLSLVNSCV